MVKYESIAKKILSLAKQKGADDAYCYVLETETSEFNVEGNEFSLFRTLFARKISLTLFIDGKKGSVGINKFDDEEIVKAVDDCIDVAKSATPDKDWELARDNGKKHFCDGVIKPDTEKLFFRSKELLEDIKARHPLIIIEQMIVMHKSCKGVYMSTTGNEYYIEEGRYLAELVYSAHEGEKATSFYSSDVTLCDLDKPFIECAMIERDLTDIENQINSTATRNKFEGTVIFTPACLAGTVFGNVCGNFASDSALLDGTSVWKDKLGEQVADERITVSFKPSDERIVCGTRFSGEGYLAEDFDFIKNGKLNSFLISQYVANKTGNKRAPNNSFSLIIEAGETPLSEMIKKVERGVIIGRFSGGSPGANGEFSGVAKNGFMIENGKITTALSETMISGNLADMLFNIYFGLYFLLGYKIFKFINTIIFMFPTITG